MDTGKFIKRIATGKAQGVAIDSQAGKYFVSVSREKKLVIIDSKKMEKTGEVALGGPADALVFNPKNHCAYVGHDDANDLWVIDTHSEKLVATIPIGEGPEYVLYDSDSDRVFQNIKSNDTLLVIDPASNTVKETWPTAPAKHPHGLAFNPKTHRLFCAGQNGKLAIIDSTSGKVISSVDIATGIDQIAFDAPNSAPPPYFDPVCFGSRKTTFTPPGFGVVKLSFKFPTATGAAIAGTGALADAFACGSSAERMAPSTSCVQ